MPPRFATGSYTQVTAPRDKIERLSAAVLPLLFFAATITSRPATEMLHADADGSRK
jgi:hypothetical protein